MPPKVLSAQSLAEKAGVEPSVVGPGAIVPTSSSAPHPAARAPEKETWTEAGGEGIVCFGFDLWCSFQVRCCSAVFYLSLSMYIICVSLCQFDVVSFVLFCCVVLVCTMKVGSTTMCINMIWFHRIYFPNISSRCLLSPIIAYAGGQGAFAWGRPSVQMMIRLQQYPKQTPRTKRRQRPRRRPRERKRRHHQVQGRQKWRPTPHRIQQLLPFQYFENYWMALVLNFRDFVHFQEKIWHTLKDLISSFLMHWLWQFQVVIYIYKYFLFWSFKLQVQISNQSAS